VKWIEYPYTPIWNGYSVILKPLLEITILHGNDSLLHTALLDSGSDVTLMSADIAKTLGIDLSQCEHKFISGIDGEPMEGFMTDVDINVQPFAGTLQLPILFVPGLDHSSLLGQYGFFEHFRVRFDKDRDIFALMKVPRKKNRV